MEIFSPEKNIDIAYKISGNEEGPKMVLIHGLFLNSDCWKYQLPAYEPEFHILRFDLRGHGRSTKPKKRFTIRNYVDDMHALLNHINWNNNMYLVGHSLGGMIAMVYALENPSHVKKLVVADSFCFISQEAITDVLGRVNSSKLEKFAIGISVRGLTP
ncbi:MAG: alpha/beta fold hydrolase, partial [Promethearchaeota archaeon]